MMEDEVVTLSEFVEGENVDCQDHFVKNEDSLERHLKDGEEIQRLRDRVEELEIEKVQSEIDIMELEQQVKSLESLQSRKTDHCSNCKEKGDNKSDPKEPPALTPSLEQCLGVIRAQEEAIREKEEKIELLLRKFKDWGLDETKIFEEPKRKKAKKVIENPGRIKKGKTERKIKPSNSDNSEDDIPLIKRKSKDLNIESKFDIIKRKRRVRFQLDYSELDEEKPLSVRKSNIRPKEESVDPHEEFCAQHYEFDWTGLPTRLHDVTSSVKLRKVGRKFICRPPPLLKNTFITKKVPESIRDISNVQGSYEYNDEEDEEYFVFKKSPVVKIRKLKRKSLPNLGLDL